MSDAIAMAPVVIGSQFAKRDLTYAPATVRVQSGRTGSSERLPENDVKGADRCPPCKRSLPADGFVRDQSVAAPDGSEATAFFDQVVKAALNR